MDRTLDIIRAATANRQELGGEMSMDETATMASFQQSRTVHCNKRKYNSDDKVADMEVEKEADNGTEHMDDDEDGRRTRRRGDDSENQVEVSHETQNMDDVRTTVICLYVPSFTINSKFLTCFAHRVS